ncbi:MAG: antitoxin MazE family protein [Jatrophihabitantaceae bacterium]
MANRTRARLRSQGLRPIQLWVPDVNAPGFADEAHRQSRAVAASHEAESDQAFVDAVPDCPEGLRRGAAWFG